MIAFVCTISSALYALQYFLKIGDNYSPPLSFDMNIYTLNLQSTYVAYLVLG